MTSQDRSWWKVIVVDGGRWHYRDWLLNRIKELCRYPFREVNFHVNGSDLVFFVNNGAVAGSLVDASNRIRTRDGTRVIIKVSASSDPWHRRKSNFDRNIILNKEMQEQLKICLGHRFDVSTSSLNLSEFIHDPFLKNARVEEHISNPFFMYKVFDIICSLFPHLKVLDLSKNDISKLKSLAPLAEKCPELDQLILSYNKICFAYELQNINDHKNITKLWLKGNPVEQQCSHNSYTSTVKKLLPMLQNLDGCELPVMTFGFETKIRYSLPNRKDVYAANRNDLEIVKSFVHIYFQWYDHFDSNRRARLIDFYDNDALFSLCCNSQLESPISLDLPCVIVQNNRNFKDGGSNNHTKSSFLITKKINIISFLTELPTSNHWTDSFSLDLSLVTPLMVCFKVQGMYIEGENETPRGFSRTFVTQRVSNSQLSILNEQLVIRSLTDNQILIYEDAKYNNAAAPLAVTINIDDDNDELTEDKDTVFARSQDELVTKFAHQLKLIDPVVQKTLPVNETIPLEKQEELTLQLIAETKMNMVFSKMCLESSSWDYDHALSKFSKIYVSGGIPAEVFVT